jgi:hypothetical protein
LQSRKIFLYLAGTILEFSGGINGKGFVFNNPNAGIWLWRELLSLKFRHNNKVIIN